MKMHFLLISTAVILFNFSANFSSNPKVSNSGTITSKSNTEFSFFRTHRQGKAGVTATWGFTSADAVTGFLVQRTYQDPTDPYSIWEDISLLPSDPSRSFTYTDENVLAGIIYYRIVAQMADGNSITSDVSNVKIVQH